MPLLTKGKREKWSRGRRQSRPLGKSHAQQWNQITAWIPNVNLRQSGRLHKFRAIWKLSNILSYSYRWKQSEGFHNLRKFWFHIPKNLLSLATADSLHLGSVKIIFHNKNVFQYLSNRKEKLFSTYNVWYSRILSSFVNQSIALFTLIANINPWHLFII